MNNRIEPQSSTLTNLVEEYISLKRDVLPVDLKYFESALRKLGKSTDQIHALLIEMDDDADEELLAGAGLKQSNRIFTFGLILGIVGLVLIVLWALDLFGFGSGRLTIVPFGLIAGAFVAVGKSYAEIGLVEKRRKRRAMKYQKWN